MNNGNSTWQINATSYDEAAKAGVASAIDSPDRDIIEGNGESLEAWSLVSRQ